MFGRPQRDAGLRRNSQIRYIACLCLDRRVVLVWVGNGRRRITRRKGTGERLVQCGFADSPLFCGRMQVVAHDAADPRRGRVVSASHVGSRHTTDVARLRRSSNSPVDYFVATATPFAAFAMRSATACGCDT